MLRRSPSLTYLTPIDECLSVKVPGLAQSISPIVDMTMSSLAKLLKSGVVLWLERFIEEVEISPVSCYESLIFVLLKHSS